MKNPPLRSRLARAVADGLRGYLRASPVQRGKWRVLFYGAELVRRLGPLPQDTFAYDFGGGVLQLRFPQGSIAAVLQYMGHPLERPKIAAMLDWLAQFPAPVLLDVGANIGTYTLAFAQKFGAGGRVLAIEPLPFNLALLRENLARNGLPADGPGLRICACALSSQAGAAQFQVSADSGWGSLTHASGAPQAAIRVPTERGDRLLRAQGVEEVHFCKIDVEGGELLVLAGLEGYIRERRIRRLQVEIGKAFAAAAGHTPAAVVAWFAERGYRLEAASAALLATPHWRLEDFFFEPA